MHEDLMRFILNVATSMTKTHSITLHVLLWNGPGCTSKLKADILNIYSSSESQPFSKSRVCKIMYNHEVSFLVTINMC
jgi:hypothetical protein